MWPLLFIYPFILATSSAQRLRQRQVAGGLDGVAGLDSLLPLQFSVVSATTLASSTAAAVAAVAGATPLSTALSSNNVNPQSGAAAAESAAYAAFGSKDNYYATVGSLTGSALAAESAYIQAEDSYYATAFPPLTGSAAAAESAAFVSEDSYFASAFPPLTGSAAAAESAAFASEDSYYASAFPPLTGSAAAAESAAFAAEDSYYAAAYPATGTAAAAAASANAAADSAYPVLTGTAAAAYSAALASFDSAYGTATAAPSTPLKDACGPAIPDPTVPDSCDTPVQQVSAPAAWGVQCLNDTGSSAPINITSCAPLIVELCSNQWQNLGKWTWLTGPGCAIGSFLPPTSFAGVAPGPTQSACEELIYASMVDDCQFAGVPWNLAGVNVKVFPADGLAGSGAAVNVGYGSYVVAGRQLRTVSDDPNCTFVPPDDYCRGNGCFPPSYYRSKFQKPTPCAALGSPAASFRPLGG